MDNLIEISELDNLLYGMCHVSSFTYKAQVLIHSDVARSQTTPGHCTCFFLCFFFGWEGEGGRAGGMLP